MAEHICHGLNKMNLSLILLILFLTEEIFLDVGGVYKLVFFFLSALLVVKEKKADKKYLYGSLIFLGIWFWISNMK